MEFEFVDESVVGAIRKKRVPGGSAPDPIILGFSEALRDKPFQWAKYPKALSGASMYTLASRINGGAQTIPTCLRSGFQAAARNHTLYVRFVGGNGR